MEIHDVIQGSPEWLALRAQYDTASEAPAMMGCSKYQTRAELLRQKATGYTPTVDRAKQALFDRGHATEAAARVLVEELIGEDLYPVTGSLGRLLASYDGLTMDERIGYEHKLWNETLAAQVRAGDLEPHHYWQLEQQILVGGLEKVIFVCSDGTRDNFVHMEYRAVPGRADQLVAGWKQFAEDLASYQHVEVQPAAVATEQPSLPAVVVRMGGALTVDSNLPDFAVALREYISTIPKNPSTDVEFADCEAACKSLKKAEDALQAAEDNALAGMTDVEAMRRVVAELRALARATRLASEKTVEARKISIRAEILQEHSQLLSDHLMKLNQRLGKNYMPAVPADFPFVMKGKKTVQSLRDACSQELARAKIAANEAADKISINLDYLRENAKDYAFLFADTASIVLKAGDDLAALVQSRIMAHQKAEADRPEKERAAIAEQERIKAEAKVRAEQVEQAAREKAEQAEADRTARELIQQPTVAKPVFQPVEPVADQPMPEVADQAAVVPIRPQGNPTMNLGKISAVLGFTVSAAFLAQIGCQPAKTERASVLYHDRDILAILEAMGVHLSAVYAREKAKYQPTRSRTAA